jgi:hypothetical protein
MTSSSTVVPLRQPGEVDDPLAAVLRSVNGGRIPGQRGGASAGHGATLSRGQP